MKRRVYTYIYVRHEAMSSLLVRETGNFTGQT